MSGDSLPISELAEMASKQGAIETIRKHDKAAFDTWVTHPENKQKLNLPDSVIRAFIPPRLYDFASNPTNVQALNVWEPRDSMCQMLFYIHEDTPVSNPDRLAKYIQEIRAKRQAGEAPLLPFPDDIDLEHFLHSELIEQGILTAFDKITNKIILDMPDPFDYPDVLQVGDFEDRAELRGKGVATSFYTQLRTLAREMGFRIITGSNNERNIAYFRDKLGRSSMSSIRPELRERLGFPSRTEGMETQTIDFLYPEDKEKFMK